MFVRPHEPLLSNTSFRLRLIKPFRQDLEGGDETRTQAMKKIIKYNET